MLKIRLQRNGTKHRPIFRIVVAESTSKQSGFCIEQLGYYNPKNDDLRFKCVLKIDRYNYWIKNGAQPTNIVLSLHKQQLKNIKNN